MLFDVISTAYEKTSVIVTTNLPFERWTEVLGSDRLVAATLDRLTHRCHLLEATGESYRLKEARRRPGGQPPGRRCSQRNLIGVFPRREGVIPQKLQQGCLSSRHDCLVALFGLAGGLLS